MTSTEWVPFDLTEDERAERAVLLEGVPPHLRSSLVLWTVDRLSQTSNLQVSAHFLRALELGLGIDLQVGFRNDARSPMEVTDVLARVPERALLQVIDRLLPLERLVLDEHAESLDNTLRTGRSKWSVGTLEDQRRLVERVPSGVQDTVEGVIADSGAAGRLLGRAWSRVHGLEPDDSAAYFDAVKAVEAVAIPLVVRHQREPVLGHVIGQMKNDGDWRLPLREHDDAPTAEVVLGMLRTLYRGHHDRHGAADYVDVTHEEASAAVLLAATLVGWFASGAIARRAAE